jgi:hypothetical protein
MQAYATPEHWLPVVGYESLYEVSNLGRVRSSAHGKGRRYGHILKPALSRQGYRVVVLCQNGNLRTQQVHALVAAAFVGSRPAGYQINHKNCNKLDNAPANLEYLSVTEHHEHTRINRLLATGNRHGSQTRPESRTYGERNGARLHPDRILRGEALPQTRLTEAQVREILHNSNHASTRRLAAQFNVSRTTIQHVLHGRTWKHITGFNS